MRSIVVQRFGGPDVLALAEREAPSPGPGQVAIDVAYAGVNFAEIGARKGANPALEPPFVPGMEVSGTVRELGEGVAGFAVGDPVCAMTGVGGYAEVAVAAVDRSFHLPDADDATLRRGASFPTVVPTAWGLVKHAGRLAAGEDVLIAAAAGGVGTVAAQIARLLGAGRVVGVTSSAEKASYAKQFGYDEVLLESEWSADPATSLGEGVDVVLDSVGGEFRAAALTALRPFGRLVVFGNASGADEADSAPVGILRAECKAAVGFSISGFNRVAPERARASAEEALAKLLDGELRVDVTEVLPLREAPSAHERMEGRRTTGKLLLAVG